MFVLNDPSARLRMASSNNLMEASPMKKPDGQRIQGYEKYRTVLGFSKMDLVEEALGNSQMKIIKFSNSITYTASPLKRFNSYHLIPKRGIKTKNLNKKKEESRSNSMPLTPQYHKNISKVYTDSCQARG
jgi:uncharacterized protein (DUF1919 family)